MISWHRFYDPETGRYMSADPIGLGGGMNLYAYTDGDPVNWIDPDGLSATDVYSGPAVIPINPLPGGDVPRPGRQKPDELKQRPNPGIFPLIPPVIIGTGIGIWMGERKKGETEPYSLPVVDPGRDCEGNCKPCPPDSPVWGHTHKDGVSNTHQIVYEQNPTTCVCYPKRIHVQ